MVAEKGSIQDLTRALVWSFSVEPRCNGFVGIVYELTLSYKYRHVQMKFSKNKVIEKGF